MIGGPGNTDEEDNAEDIAEREEAVAADNVTRVFNEDEFEWVDIDSPLESSADEGHAKAQEEAEEAWAKQQEEAFAARQAELKSRTQAEAGAPNTTKSGWSAVGFKMRLDRSYVHKSSLLSAVPYAAVAGVSFAARRIIIASVARGRALCFRL